MPQAQTIRVRGLREFQRGISRAEKSVRKETKEAWAEAGEIVREPWSSELDRYGSKTATGLRTSVRQTGVSVRQSRRKTTGKRADFGHRQQLIGERILEDREREIGRAAERALDRIADNFEKGALA